MKTAHLWNRIFPAPTLCPKRFISNDFLPTHNFGEHGMKAVVLTSHGPPDSSLSYEWVRKPQPKEGEVLVKINAATINPIDCLMRNGYGKEFFFPLPIILGRDCAGVVEEVGSGVTNLKEGDRVFACPNIFTEQGTHARYICLSEYHVARSPNNSTDIQAASVGFVGYMASFTAEIVRLETSCLVHGAAGGVGYFLTQYLLNKGCRVIGTSKSAKSLAKLQKLNARYEKTFQIYDTSKGFDELRKIVSDQKVECVVQCAGGEEFENMIVPSLKRGSIFMTYQSSLLQGKSINDYALRIPPHGNSSTNDANKEQKFQRHLIYFKPETGKREEERRLSWVKTVVESGIVIPDVDTVFPFQETRAAHLYLETGLASGKVVLDISHE